MTKRNGVAALVAVCAVALGACSSSSSGAPKTLSLSGEKVPVSQVTSAYSQMCAVAKQAQTDPAGTVGPFANTESGLNLLATVLDKDHPQQSQRLLAALTTYTDDIGHTPPPAASATDANNLLATAKQGLQALDITAPSC
jgi:hypothetical protein